MAIATNNTINYETCIDDFVKTYRMSENPLFLKSLFGSKSRFSN